jgi:beta-fructofuranosidase
MDLLMTGINPGTRQQAAEKARYHRSLFRDDPHRPQYHYLPPAHWLNDPNGLIQFEGNYHLFYQYNPNGAYHDTIHWGHAVSHDLVHWEEWPIALTPTPGDHDQDGCWSGCAINNNGQPTIFYSGVHPQVVCMATSSDGLLTWQKYPGNPIISDPPDEIDSEGQFRDPFVWWEDGGWTMLMGTRSVEMGGAVLLYRSDDLVNWEYLHPLIRGDKYQTAPFRTGSIWECPNLLQLEDKHVLIVSFQHHESGRLLYTGYFTGDYHNHFFTHTKQGLVDYGHSFYAPQAMTDTQGRHLMWGWLREARPEAVQRRAGWAGVMSLPRVLSVGEDDVLLMTPAPELAALRGEEFRLDTVTVSAESDNVLATVQGDALEILLEVEFQSGTALGLHLLQSPDAAEQTLIMYDLLRQNLLVDASCASLDTTLKPEPVTAYHPLAQTNRLTLRLFIDRSVIELFADARTCVTSRVYPTRPDSIGLALFVENGTVIIHRLSVWSMNSIWD